MQFNTFKSNSTTQAWGTVIGNLKTLLDPKAKIKLIKGKMDDKGNYLHKRALIMITLPGQEEKQSVHLSPKLSALARTGVLNESHLAWLPIRKGNNQAGEERMVISLAVSDGVSMEDIKEIDAEFAAA